MSLAQPSVDVNTPLAESEYALGWERNLMLSANGLLDDLSASMFSQAMVLSRRSPLQSPNASRSMGLQEAKVRMIKQEMNPSDHRGGGNSWAASATRDSG